MTDSMTLQPSAAPTRARDALVRALRAPIEARTWRETLHLLLNLPVGIVVFTVIVTGVSTGLGLLITLIGIPILYVTMILSRGLATIERERARALLHVDVPPAYRPDPPRDTWWRVPLARVTDPAAWVEAGYHLLLLPVGIFTFTITVVLWSVGLALVTVPLYGPALPSAPFIGSRLTRLIVDTPAEYGLLVAFGVLVLLVTPWVVHGLATANGLLVRGMLGSDVIARERTLTETRAAAVELAAEDRRRIERDLHDGVQQRLVSLAMTLGRAREKLQTDPERAGELVAEAHETAKLAIVEVRDLARGIHPAVLTDRGLDAAVSSLAARSPVPVSMSVDVDERPPASTEAAAYYVVAEALTNVAKHARASKADVTIRRSGDRLTVQVRDDGVGGATIADDAGLAGLRDRVRALDGELHLLSPQGGPTVLMAEIPCAS
jgi:signal transduction histidine kinase